MSPSVRAILTAMALAVVVYFFVAYHPEDVGGSAPDFSLQNQSGQQVRLSDFRGQWVLLHFWATWCETCRSEMPAFNRMAQTLRVRLPILGISLDDSGRGNAWAAIETYEKGQPLDFMVLMDTKSKVADQYGSYAVPETYLIDPQGQIVKKWGGAGDWVRELPSLEQRISNNPKK